MRRISAILIAITLMFSAGATLADDTASANKLFVEAVKLVNSAEKAEGPIEKAEVLEEALAKLNKIIDDYPSTDLAVKLISGQNIGAISLEGVGEVAERAQRKAERAREEAEERAEFEKTLKLAEQGNVGAQHNLGLMYYSGEGVPKNDAEAVKWWRKAAEQGLANAQYNLGWMYYRGEGVPRNPTEALEWWRKAADQGHKRAKVWVKDLEEEAERKREEAERAAERKRERLIAPVIEGLALALPDPALLQETSRGALPIIGPDGREPWRVYGRKVGPASGLPRMAIIVSGLGLSPDATARAIELPKEVTLSFTAYGSDLEADVAAARAAGHEVLLDLPMEPISYPADDPGPHTLLTSVSPSDNIFRLNWLLGRFKGYVGVINHMGSRFTASPEPLRPILRALKDRGLMFVDSRSTSKSVAAGLAGQMQLPRALNDRFLDHEPTRGAIDQSFAAAEGDARARGVALVVARPFPITLERLAAWLPMLKSRGIEIVPVTALANKQALR